MSSKDLVKLKDLPSHLQFNPHILAGYRRPLSTTDCVRSVCYRHNESFNIYSHLICLAYFLQSLYQYSHIWQQNKEWTLVTVFIIIDYIATTVPFALSVVYHIFMCHISGAGTYRKILKLDILGIWILATFAELQTIHVTLYNYNYQSLLAISIYLFFSLIILAFLMLTDGKRLRAILWTAQFMFRIAVLMIRYSSYGCGPQHYYYVVMETLCGTAVVINALHIPERWFTGKLDYTFNSHTIMHVMCGLGILFGRQGFLIDVAWISNQIN